MILIVPYFRKWAFKLKFLDKKDGVRKLHENDVPLIGGITLAITIFLSMFISGSGSFMISGENLSFFTSAIMLLIMGVVDDSIDLKPIFRLCIQFLCSYFFVSTNPYILSYFNITWIPQLFQELFLMLLIVGVINAYNMIDGIDGLSGGMFLLGFFWLACSAWLIGAIELFHISVVISGSLIGFLKFNFDDKNKIFLGDGGAMSLAFILIGFYCSLVKEPGFATKEGLILAGALSIMILPIFDTVRVVLIRIKIGKSPFSADRRHIHHILLHIQSSHRTVSGWIFKMTSMLFLISISLYFFIGLFISFLFLAISLIILTIFLQIYSDLIRNKSILEKMELK